MTSFLTIARHTAESCPRMNEKGRKVILDVAENLEALAKKSGVKLVGVWSGGAPYPQEHLIVSIYESPSLEAWEKLQMQPEVVAWNALNTTETKIGINLQDVVKMVRQAK
jgi:hypothetical protein